MDIDAAATGTDDNIGIIKNCPQSEKSRRNDELVRMARQGDKKAADELIECNLGLVRSIALRFCGRGTEYEDLVQIGTLGMLRAVKSFDFSFGTTFSTYAVPLIMGEIKRYLRDNGPIKISRSLRQTGSRLLRLREQFTAEHGCEPRVSELAEQCGITPEEAAEALEACSSVVSLNSPVSGDEDLTLEGIISDPSDVISSVSDRIALGEAISSLPPLWRRIIVLRYFRNLSQQEAGNLLGISQVKVSREEKKIIERLRREL